MSYVKLIPCNGRMVSMNRASALKQVPTSTLHDKRKRLITQYGEIKNEPWVEKYLYGEYTEGDLPLDIPTTACDNCSMRVVRINPYRNSKLCDKCLDNIMLWDKLFNGFSKVRRLRRKRA